VVEGEEEELVFFPNLKNDLLLLPFGDFGLLGRDDAVKGGDGNDNDAGLSGTFC
jgi:hypothetical protein